MEGSYKPLFKMILMKLSSFAPGPYPHQSAIHTIPYFLVGIICGPIWGSFPVRDHLWSRDHLWTRRTPSKSAGIFTDKIK